jgi:hypothetical protein
MYVDGEVNPNRHGTPAMRGSKSKMAAEQKSGWRANRSAAGAKVGAGDGNRTHDTQLGKLMFYH